MTRHKTASAVVTLRVPPDLDRRLALEARRSRKTRSEVVRLILEERLGAGEPDLASEAQRQSQLVSRRRSERDVLDFVQRAADRSRWR